jgi:hypothetical protein
MSLRYVLAFLLIMLSGTGFSAETEQRPPDLVPLDDQPDIPAPIESGETMQPDVTITKRGKDTVEEYRINDRLYMIKITPVIGPSYYMVDTDGNGTLDQRRGTVQEGMKIPQWVLFSW